MEEIKNEYNIYIDESGDEGIHKGSKYFILTAIIVKKEKDLEISKKVDKIKEDLELNIKTQLHWNKIKGFPNKKTIMETVRDTDLAIINVVIDTNQIKFINSSEIYFYFSGYLYERICRFMTSKKAKANINISTRGDLKKEKLINYLNSRNEHKFEIDMNRIKQIKIYPNSQKKLLQLADCCCSSLGQALNYADKTHFTYIDIIKSKYYSVKGKILGYGLKYVPSTKIYSKEFNDLIIFLEII